MQSEGPSTVNPGRVLDQVVARLYTRDGWSVIEIAGELDIENDLRIRRLRLRAGPRLVFDLRRVTFVDCGGLRAISGPDAFGRTSRDFVCGSNGRARMLLELFGSGTDLVFYASVDEALLARV